MEKLSGIRACVFDAYGTLFDVGGPVAKLANEIGPRAAEISALWRQKQLEYSWLRSLMGVHADFWHVTGDALDYALERFEVNEPGLRDEILALYLKLDPYPEVAEALAAVKAKSKLTAILSNGSPSMLESAVRHAGLDKLFNIVLSVEDFGIYSKGVNGFERPVDAHTVRNNRKVGSFSDNCRFSDFHGKIPFWHFSGDTSVEGFMFEEEYGIGIFKSSEDHSFGISRVRRVEDFESRRMKEPGLIALGVKWTCACTCSRRHTHDHIGMLSPAVMQFCEVIDDLIKATGDKIGELHFHHSFEPF